MEKVFASVRLYLEISVAVARTSQSPFPLYAMRLARLQKLKFFKDRTESKDLLKTKPLSISNLFFFPAVFLPTHISTFAKCQR